MLKEDHLKRLFSECKTQDDMNSALMGVCLEQAKALDLLYNHISAVSSLAKHLSTSFIDLEKENIHLKRDLLRLAALVSKPQGLDRASVGSAKDEVKTEAKEPKKLELLEIKPRKRRKK